MSQADRAATYQITIAGHLAKRRRDWLNGMALTNETGSGGIPMTCLVGIVPDQAALRGLLTRIWDLGLVVMSVVRMSEVSCETLDQESLGTGGLS